MDCDVMDFKEIADDVEAVLQNRDRVREEALSMARSVIRLASDSIRMLHRGNIDSARKLAGEATERIRSLWSLRESCPEIYYTGFIHDAQKEYSESMISIATLTDEEVPGPLELCVDPVAYLNGMCEAIGELRRSILDFIRAEDMSRAESLLQTMEDMHVTLVSFDYPDAIMRGIRKRIDGARGIIERTRGDLTTAAMQNKLEGSMQRLREKLK